MQNNNVTALKRKSLKINVTKVYLYQYLLAKLHAYVNDSPYTACASESLHVGTEHLLTDIFTEYPGQFRTCFLVNDIRSHLLQGFRNS